MDENYSNYRHQHPHAAGLVPQQLAKLLCAVA